VERLRAIYDRIFAERAGRDVGDQFDLAGADEEGKAATLPQILNPSKYAPELLEAAYRANAETLARQLLGPDAKFLGEHAIFKPARIGAATPWHQDEAYWEADQEYEAISVWMPLQVATVENGCMWFVPGSHLLEVQPHHNIDNDPRITGLVIDQIDPEGAVACPIPAGGATVHHCRTLHYTGPNRSDIPRRAYILIFGVPPRQRAETRDFYWRKHEDQQLREVRRRASESTSGAAAPPDA
jgi:ectoine hydroxylase-related dioxygenase (phytanoyl-CoA dioxygenase family)